MQHHEQCLTNVKGTKEMRGDLTFASIINVYQGKKRLKETGKMLTEGTSGAKITGNFKKLIFFL